MNRDSMSADIVERVVRAADGRALQVQEGGRRDGRPVLVLAGTPSSRHLYRPHLLDALRRGIRLFSYDRPGYGGSDPQPGRAIADCAADVAAIADALGIRRFAVWGISAGGAHALACASLLGDRVVAAATFAAPAPHGAAGLDYYAGMGQDNIDDARLLLTDPATARARYLAQREAMLSATAADLLATYPALLSATDAAVLTGELADYYARRDKDSLAPGIEGWWDDGQAMMKPWSFALERIGIPVMLWHGREDRFVPFRHGEWLAERIPGARLDLSDEDGHLTLFQRRVPAVHGWLLEHF